MKIHRWLVPAVLAALVVAAAVPQASVAEADGQGTLFLARHKKHALILTATFPDHKGGHHEDARINPKKPDAKEYKELGTWDSGPASPSRIIDLGKATLWLSRDGDKKEESNVQVKVEVLKNGSVVDLVPGESGGSVGESGCVTLRHRSGSAVLEPTVIELPAPRPPIKLAANDVFGLRVSVRDGSAVPNCAGGDKHYKVRLDFDGTRTPSNLTLETAGPAPAAGLIVVGQPSFIDEKGILFVMPQTPITIPIGTDADLSTCSIKVFGPGLPPEGVAIPCSQGTNLFTFGDGAPFGDYRIRAEVVVGGQPRSDLLEVTLVASLPP